ncbi:MAG: DJ-1/PfpI family protein [Chromatiales bacterium]|nr:DJ-1/PfpI family protein [Chromatiales bacterium]
MNSQPSADPAMRRTVAILLFDDVEVLDFAGPFEVFAVTDELSDYRLFQVQTVAPAPGTVRARNGLRIVPDHSLATAPAPDILIVPGGSGSRALLDRSDVLDWIRSRAPRAEVVASVCTGARLLARTGLLDGLGATTHHENIAELAALAPAARWMADRRFVDHGRIATSAGISAGIDLSLHLVARLCSPAIAERTARYMEYPWRNDGGLRR